MAGLFLLAAVVQLNDPDPARWVAIYLAASLLSTGAALGRWCPSIACGSVAIVAVVWSGTIVFAGPGATEYTHMFDAWEMRSIAVEEAREASGLIIVAAWMTVLALRSARLRVTARA